MTQQVEVLHRWVDGPDVLTWFELRTATAGPLAIVNCSVCASSGQCSRPPRAARRLSAWRCARPMSGSRTSAFAVATTRRGRLWLLLWSIPRGRASCRRGRLLAAAGCEPEQALLRSRVAGASPGKAAPLLPQRQLRAAPTPASSRGCSGLARAPRRVVFVHLRSQVTTAPATAQRGEAMVTRSFPRLIMRATRQSFRQGMRARPIIRYGVAVSGPRAGLRRTTSRSRPSRCGRPRRV